MSIFQTIILGIIEGLTEFLPVSSTGHLILASRLLDIKESGFLSSFTIAIQLGAILAVTLLYWRSLLLDAKVFKRVAAAFIPTAGIGFISYKFIKEVLLQSEMVVVWALGIGGIVLVAFEAFYKKKDHSIGEIAQLTYPQAVAIGVFQSLAMIPGVSRSAATIIGGLALGLKRRAIVEFSFLLAVPTMAAAAGWDMLKSASAFSFGQLGILVLGFIVSFLVALASVKFLLYFIKNHNFVAFGIYRVAAAVLFLLLR